MRNPPSRALENKFGV